MKTIKYFFIILSVALISLSCGGSGGGIIGTDDTIANSTTETGIVIKDAISTSSNQDSISDLSPDSITQNSSSFLIESGNILSSNSQLFIQGTIKNIDLSSNIIDILDINISANNFTPITNLESLMDTIGIHTLSANLYAKCYLSSSNTSFSTNLIEISTSSNTFLIQGIISKNSIAPNLFLYERSFDTRSANLMNVHNTLSTEDFFEQASGNIIKIKGQEH